jgi:hypothetical protein
LNAVSWAVLQVVGTFLGAYAAVFTGSFEGGFTGGFCNKLRQCKHSFTLDVQEKVSERYSKGKTS